MTAPNLPPASEDAAPTEPAPATPVAAPPAPDWRSDFGDEEIRGATSLGKFSGPEPLAKSYLELEKLVQAKGVVPPQDESPEERDRYHTALGRPASIQEYDLGDFQPPEGLPWDHGFGIRMMQAMHDQGLTSEQATGMLQAFSGDQNEQWTAHMQGQEAAVSGGLEELRGEWGQAFDSKFALAKQVYKNASGIDEVDELVFADGRRFGDHPTVLKVFAALGEELREHNVEPMLQDKTQKYAFSPAEAQSRIDAKLADPDFRTAWITRDDPGHKAAVEEMNSLHEAAVQEEAGTA